MGAVQFDPQSIPCRPTLRTMLVQVLSLSLIACASASPPPLAYHPAKEVYPDAVPVYKYEYGVADDYSKAAFSHKESRDGYATNGDYRVNLPDGRVQIVTYSSGPEGYVADVKYEGEAVYPEAAPYKPAPVYHAAPKHAPVYHTVPKQAPIYHAEPIYNKPAEDAPKRKYSYTVVTEPPTARSGDLPQEAAPTEEVALTEEVASIEAVLTEEVAQTEESAPTEEADPTEEVAPIEAVLTEEAAPIEETAPTEEAVPTEEAAPTEEVAPTEEAVPTEEAAPIKEAALIDLREDVPVEDDQSNSDEKATPAEDNSSISDENGIEE